MNGWKHEKTIDLTRDQVSGAMIRVAHHDAKANEWIVHVLNNGVAVDLSGYTAKAIFLRSDGATVISSAEIDGNDVVAILPSSAYSVAGAVLGAITIYEDEDRTITIDTITLEVYMKGSDTIAPEDHTILVGDDDLETESQTLTGAINEIFGALATKQATLVSGTNIKTINGETILGSGNITLDASDVGALPSTTVIPSKTSDLTNDSGFITEDDLGDDLVKREDLEEYATKDEIPDISGKADRTEIPDVSGLASKAEVKEVADDVEIVTTKVDYATESLKTKLSKPSENPTVGKVLKVKSVNSDGTFVCEWASEQDISGKQDVLTDADKAAIAALHHDAVSDVQINGTSAVVDGVANVPVASSTDSGVLRVWPEFGHTIDDEGRIKHVRATNANIDSRTHENRPIVPKNLDYAVKASLTDGKAVTAGLWDAESQKACCATLGAEKAYRHIAYITVDESGVANVSIDKDENGNSFALTDILIHVQTNAFNASTILAYAINTTITSYTGSSNIIKQQVSTSGVASEVHIYKDKYWRGSIMSINGTATASQAYGNIVISNRGASTVRANEWDTVSSLAMCVENEFGIGTEFDIWGR